MATVAGASKTFRPFAARMAGSAAMAVLILVTVVAWFSLPPEIRAKFTLFEKCTMALLAALALATWFALMRSRAVLTEQGLIVVNGYKRRDFEWAEVIAVHLTRGAPWATLDIHDGSTCSVLAVQATDGHRARAAVAAIREHL